MFAQQAALVQIIHGLPSIPPYKGGSMQIPGALLIPCDAERSSNPLRCGALVKAPDSAAGVQPEPIGCHALG
ncbi:hypothetical protein AAL_05450 [Moelleriella libera RCEF 2490]|uniref:Uncharacterized protein n=1 Tax=Moelleriella libera RCEF 2490 TaxID=1081109 RepID=A0A168ABU7_9HYPO|nr:hypothetical protein AAL_05450 [Moelleriella libera RCEF 2490]